MATARRCILMAAVALAGLSAPVVAADAGIDKVAGVYKKAFANANIDGHKYPSEDILEIAKISPTSAYVRAHLEFFNGHICDIWAVADVEGDALVYRARQKNVQGKLCVLTIKAKNGKIALEDKDGACAIGTCGNRGMYNGTAFDLKNRRPIRYMKLMTKSDQYQDAVDEHNGTPRTRRP